MKFSALNTDIKNPSRDSLGSRSFAQASVKEVYLPKMVILPLLARLV